MSTPIEKLIRDSVKCVKCGAKFGTCKCWKKCECGWMIEVGFKCNNPIHKKRVGKVSRTL